VAKEYFETIHRKVKDNDPQEVVTREEIANFITQEDIPTQVQSDWNASSGPAYIANKPTIPPAVEPAVLSSQAADFGQSAQNGTLETFARSDHYHALPNIPAIPEAGNLTDQQAEFGQVKEDGSATTFARSDHYHALPEQVQSDWNNADLNHPAFIKNKPIIGGPVGTQSDWNETDVNDPGYIKNKPDIESFMNDLSKIAVGPIVGGGTWNGTAIVLRFGNICVFMHSRTCGGTLQPLGSVPYGFRPDFQVGLMGTIVNQSAGGTLNISIAARNPGDQTASLISTSSVNGLSNQSNTISFFTMWVSNDPYPDSNLMQAISPPLQGS